MEADIVQFVPFREFRSNPMLLAKETLEEVPGQMLNYFRKQGIVPMPATEESRRKIKQQLSRQKSMGGQIQNEEDFFTRRKERFMQKCADLGYDTAAVKNFVEYHGLVEENIELVIDYMADPSYINILKKHYVPPVNPMSSGPVTYRYEENASLISATLINF